MDKVVSCKRLIAVIQPLYPKPRPQRGRPPIPLEIMLRIYCLQQSFNLSDPETEEALYDIESMPRFAQCQLGDCQIPGETTTLNLPHLLERHQLTKEIFGQVNALLTGRGLMLREGMIVDARILDASSSTKINSAKRDPEISPTKRGKQRFLAMKEHIGVDAVSGMVHTRITTTTAKTADFTETDAHWCTGTRYRCAVMAAMTAISLDDDWRTMVASSSSLGVDLPERSCRARNGR